MNMKRMLSSLCGLIILTLALTGGVFAQAKADADKAAPEKLSQGAREAAYMWKRAKKWTLQYIDAMPDDAINFKPVPEVRSFAEQMLHLAFWNYGICEPLADKPNPYGKKQEDLEKREDVKNKAALRKLVEESYDYVLATLPALDEAKLAEQVSFFGSKIPRRLILTIALDHQTHHRGQTTLYLRLKGVTPPPEPQS